MTRYIPIPDRTSCQELIKRANTDIKQALRRVN